MRLRNHWLELWLDDVTLKVKRAKANREVTVSKFKYDRLIKPEDLYDAHHCLEEYVEQLRANDRKGQRTDLWVFDDFELLGYWYGHMLWLCGAGPKEMLAVCREEPRKDGRRRRLKTWAEVVRKKYEYAEAKEGKESLKEARFQHLLDEVHRSTSSMH